MPIKTILQVVSMKVLFQQQAELQMLMEVLLIHMYKFIILADPIFLLQLQLILKNKNQLLKVKILVIKLQNLDPKLLDSLRKVLHMLIILQQKFMKAPLQQHLELQTLMAALLKHL